MTATGDFTLTKICTKCKVEQPRDNFRANKRVADGKQSYCKPCANAASAAWAAKNPGYMKKYWETYINKNMLANKAKHRQENPNSRRVEYLKNRESNITRASRWARENPEKLKPYYAKKRASKLMAVVAWSNKKKIDDIYEAARLKSISTGLSWHVDHIVPLRSKVVCGLHVEANLALMPAVENIKKGNRHWPDMP